MSNISYPIRGHVGGLVVGAEYKGLREHPLVYYPETGPLLVVGEGETRKAYMDTLISQLLMDESILISHFDGEGEHSHADWATEEIQKRNSHFDDYGYYNWYEAESTPAVVVIDMLHKKPYTVDYLNQIDRIIHRGPNVGVFAIVFAPTSIEEDATRGKLRVSAFPNVITLGAEGYHLRGLLHSRSTTSPIHTNAAEGLYSKPYSDTGSMIHRFTLAEYFRTYGEVPEVEDTQEV